MSNHFEVCLSSDKADFGDGNYYAATIHENSFWTFAKYLKPALARERGSLPFLMMKMVLMIMKN